MIYPQKLNNKNGNLIIKIAVLISVISAILLIIINKLTTPNIHWAALANSGILYVWITVIYSINKNVNIAGHVLIQTIAISLLTVYIDYKIGYRGWAFSISIPIIIIIANLTMLILTIVSYKKYFKYAIYQLIIVLFSMLPIFFLSEKIVENKVLSIVASGISIFNFIFSFVLCAKDFKEAVIRKFHV